MSTGRKTLTSDKQSTQPFGEMKGLSFKPAYGSFYEPQVSVTTRKHKQALFDSAALESIYCMSNTGLESVTLLASCFNQLNLLTLWFKSKFCFPLAKHLKTVWSINTYMSDETLQEHIESPVRVSSRSMSKFSQNSGYNELLQGVKSTKRKIGVGIAPTFK